MSDPRDTNIADIKVRARCRQLDLGLPRKQPKRPGWGGRRDGAGRPRRPGRRRVPHVARPSLAARFPVHVTVRLRDGLPRLRNFELAKVLRRAFVHGCDRGRFRICHFSVLGNHVHLICEAADARALARGVAGWKVRVARGLNGEWDRRGEVFEDRYHAEILRTPTQVRNALLYVLQNARRHGESSRGWVGGVDPFSSGRYFDGWRDPSGLPPPDPGEPLPVAAATTYLLTTAWRRRGLLGIREIPAAARVKLAPNVGEGPWLDDGIGASAGCRGGDGGRWRRAASAPRSC